MPNNKFQPTDEQRRTVLSMTGFGIPVEDIAKVIINPNTNSSICKQTMYNYFKTEIETGHVKANSKVAESLYKQAIDGNTTASIWWTKTRMGWKETNVHEVGGELKISWDEIPDDY